MCLITAQQKPIILENDMIVYKEVEIKENCVYSYYFPMEWKPGKLEKTRFSYLRDDDFEYNFTYDEIVDIYYFDCVDLLYYRKEIMKKKGLKSIARGFHFATTKERLLHPFANHVDIIGEFLIPKGAKVYFDETQLGVSNQMIFIKISDSNER